MENTNTVELIGYYGNDEIHACSAWTSTSRELDDAKRERIPKLHKQLADAGHHTPFEKSSLHFLINTDVASHIHLIKHRVGVSVNGESARYKELKEDKFFIPDDWKNIPASFISDRFGTTIDVHGENWDEVLREYSELGNELYHACLEQIEPAIGRKRAKESSRYFKAYNAQMQADVMFNWRSFYHFLGLRHKSTAQKEIYDISDQMLNAVKNIEGNPFRHTIEAFGL